jgi:hypothetical protein
LKRQQNIFIGPQSDHMSTIGLPALDS